jgi:hypothetical protein
MSRTYFLDESKSSGFMFAVAIVEQRDLATARTATRHLAAPGSRRFHASQESKSRLRSAISSVSTLPVQHLVVIADRRNPLHEARQQALGFIAEQAVAGASRIVIERDDTNVKHDVRTIREVFDSVNSDVDHAPTYVHLRAHEEPLLWIPDLVAWAYRRGTSWRSQLGALELQVKRL